MKEFRSRFNYRLYWLFAFFLPFIAISIWGLADLFQNLYRGRPVQDVGVNLVLPLVYLSLVVYAVYFYKKTSPGVVINAQTVRIGNDVFDTSEIDIIQLYSASNRFFLFMSYGYAEISAIRLHNGKEYKLFVEHYSNGSELRICLENLYNYLQGTSAEFSVAPALKDQTYPDLQLEAFKTYRQTPFKSMNFYVFLPLTLGLFWAGFFVEGTWVVKVFLVTVGVFFYVLMAWQNHYFQLSENYLLIRNLFFPWKQKAFLLSDISSLTTQNLPKQETSLKLITTDYKIHRYQSALLNDKMFDNLLHEIKSNQKALAKKGSRSVVKAYN